MVNLYDIIKKLFKRQIRGEDDTSSHNKDKEVKFMHIVVCLEDCNGIMFNKRRVSSDKILISKIIEL